MTYLVTFADRSTIRVKATRGRGQARAMAQDERMKEIGAPEHPQSSKLHHPMYDRWRIVAVKELR